MGSLSDLLPPLLLFLPMPPPLGAVVVAVVGVVVAVLHSVPLALGVELNTSIGLERRRKKMQGKKEE